VLPNGRSTVGYGASVGRRHLLCSFDLTVRRFRKGADTMRMKKRSKKPVRSKRSAGVKKLAQFGRKLPMRTIIVAVIGVGGAALLIGAAGSRVPSDWPAARTVSVPQPPSAAVPEPVAPPSAVPAAGESDSAMNDAARKFAAVTITGCLERDANSFRLRDTAGEGAPKSRSWKSAFLKKGSSPVAVVDASNRAKLPTHVGQRVSVTGTLVDREMQVRSLQRVAASCSVKS
jgi:hypothetical protein